MSEIIHGNCLEVLKSLDENSIDAIVTDPPYELGFMGKSWDKSGIAFNTEVWSECLRVLKPGGHMLAFGGSRTFHRIAVAIEDAGFELRDTLMWVYGSGFPKSYDISKGIDKQAGAEREVTGKYKRPDGTNRDYQGWNESSGVTSFNSDNYSFAGRPITAPSTPEAQLWQGWGTALKPAFEPIILARKPISEKNIAENVLKWGTGGINIDDCRIPLKGERQPTGSGKPSKNGVTYNLAIKSGGNGGNRTPQQGRWLANFIHDGSEEVLRLFPETKSTPHTPTNGGTGGVGQSTNFQRGSETSPYRDSGSAARFFYCAKASRKERGEGNNHPTVKPLALMQYIVRLITPPNGIVLDPFAGSGSTLIAAIREGFKYIGIELNEEYIEIAEKRLQSEQPLFEYNNT